MKELEQRMKKLLGQVNMRLIEHRVYKIENKLSDHEIKEIDEKIKVLDEILTQLIILI